jgi:DNA-directed RNA polymerase specialized sigma subunit
MTKHIELKHKVKNINRKTDFNSLLEESMLSEIEKKIMVMYYLENKQMNYIADELGYSEQGIIKMHKRILNKLESLL